MVKKLSFVTAIAIALSSLFAYNAFVEVSKAAQGTPSCETLPEVKSVTFSPDSRYLVAAGRGNVVLRWDIPSGERLPDLAYKGNSPLIYHVVYAPNGKYIAASTIEDAVLWDIPSGKLLYVFNAGPDTTLGGVRITFTPDSKELLISDSTGSTLWDVQSGVKVRTFSYQVGWDRLYPETVSPNGTYLLANAEDDILLWNIQTGELVKKFGFENFDIIPEATFLPDGENILIHVSHPEEHGLAVLNIWNIKAQRIIRTIDYEDIGLKWIFSPNGKYIIISPSYPGGFLEILDLNNFRKLFTIQLTDSHQGLLTFLPDNDHFLVGPTELHNNTGGIETSYDLWNLETAKVEDHLLIDDGFILLTSIAPNSKYIAAVTGTSATTLELRSSKSLVVLHKYCSTSPMFFSYK